MYYCKASRQKSKHGISLRTSFYLKVLWGNKIYEDMVNTLTLQIIAIDMFLKPKKNIRKKKYKYRIEFNRQCNRLDELILNIEKLLQIVLIAFHTYSHQILRQFEYVYRGLFIIGRQDKKERKQHFEGVNCKKNVSHAQPVTRLPASSKRICSKAKHKKFIHTLFQ